MRCTGRSLDFLDEVIRHVLLYLCHRLLCLGAIHIFVALVPQCSNGSDASAEHCCPSPVHVEPFVFCPLHQYSLEGIANIKHSILASYHTARNITTGSTDFDRGKRCSILRTSYQLKTSGIGSRVDAGRCPSGRVDSLRLHVYPDDRCGLFERAYYFRFYRVAHFLSFYSRLFFRAITCATFAFNALKSQISQKFYKSHAPMPSSSSIVMLSA